jgi:hypothetical protein
MMRSNARGRTFAAAVVIVLAVSSPRSEAGNGYMCNEIAGFVSINELTVEPPQPRVGDRVTLRFDVDYRVYSVSSLRILGTEPLLQGNTILYGQRIATFELEAARAGTTSLTLEVVYQTEDRCENEEGHVFYTPARYHTVASSPRLLTIGPGSACVGDCDGDGRVTVDELIRVLMIPLGVGSVDSCAHGNLPGDSIIDVDDLVTIVNNILNGCP